jgi:hypothetical protein
MSSFLLASLRDAPPQVGIERQEDGGKKMGHEDFLPPSFCLCLGSFTARAAQEERAVRKMGSGLRFDAFGNGLHYSFPGKSLFSEIYASSLPSRPKSVLAAP